MNNEPLIARIGTFLIMIGIGLLIIFVTSDLARLPDFDYLFGSMIFIIVGWLFRRRQPPRAASGRFSLFHRSRADREEPVNPHEQEKH